MGDAPYHLLQQNYSYVQNNVGVDPQTVAGLHESTIQAQGVAANAVAHAASVEASAAAVVSGIHSHATAAVVQAHAETELARSQGQMAQTVAMQNEALLQEARQAAAASEQRRVQQQTTLPPTFAS
mgnify:CR=1 FL=1